MIELFSLFYTLCIYLLIFILDSFIYLLDVSHLDEIDDSIYYIFSEKPWQHIKKLKKKCFGPNAKALNVA